MRGSRAPSMCHYISLRERAKSRTVSRSLHFLRSRPCSTPTHFHRAEVGRRGRGGETTQGIASGTGNVTVLTHRLFPFSPHFFLFFVLYFLFFVLAFDVSDYLPLYYHPGFSFHFIVSLVAITVSSTVAIPCTSYPSRTPRTALVMFTGDRPFSFFQSTHCTSQIVDELSLYVHRCTRRR